MFTTIRRTATALALTIATTAALAATGAPAASAAPSGHCDAADHQGTGSPASAAAWGDALTCLINEERTANGLPALRVNTRLRRAAAGHARAMLQHSFFSHRSLNGARVGHRVRATGYMRGARRWQVGEAMHWGEGTRSTPSQSLREMLDSPPHRKILMSRSVRDIGVGVVTYTRDGRNASTCVVDVGRRD